MRAYDIALFTFLFMLSANLLINMNLMGAGLSVRSEWNESTFRSAYEDINTTMAGQSASIYESSGNSWADNIVLFLSGFRVAAKILIDSTIAAPETFTMIISGFGVPNASVIGEPIGIMVIFIYVIGIVQLAFGKSMQGQS